MDRRVFVADDCAMKVEAFRIFLSSPGDVLQERQRVRAALESLDKDVFLRGAVSIDVISWDDPAAPFGFVANLPPQKALALNLPRPAVCDLTVVIFGERFGTRLAEDLLKPDGSRYFSGTEWEFDDAIAGGKDVLVYHREDDGKERGRVAPDSELEEQTLRLRAFLEQFRREDGVLSGGLNTYRTVDELAARVVDHTKQVIRRLLRQRKERRHVDRRNLVLGIGSSVAACLGTIFVTRPSRRPPEMVEGWLWSELLPVLKDLCGEGDLLSSAWLAYLNGQPNDIDELGKQYKAVNAAIDRYTSVRNKFLGLKAQYSERLDSILVRDADLHQAIVKILEASDQAFVEVKPLAVDSEPPKLQNLRAQRVGSGFNAQFNERLFSLRGDIASLEAKMIVSSGQKLPDCWSKR
jgi:hypothetical protein